MAYNQILSQGIMPHSRAVLSSRSRVYGPSASTSGTLEGSTPNNSGVSGGLELVGAISSFGISSSRTLEVIRGIGMGDHIIEMVPGQSEPIELQITKFALSLSNTFQEFGYKGGVDGLVRALKHHRYPIDIRHELLVSSKINPGILNAASSGATGAGVAKLKNAEKMPGAVENRTEDKLTDFKVLVTWFEGCWFESFNVTYPVDSAAISEESTIKVTDVSGDPNGTIVLPDSNFYLSRIWGK